MTTDQSKSHKRGRKAGGHNTKQKPIIGDPAKLFEDKPTPPEFQCFKCAHTEQKQFKFCPECGSENIWH